jgi:hypothetical protein
MAADSQEGDGSQNGSWTSSSSWQLGSSLSLRQQLTVKDASDGKEATYGKAPDVGHVESVFWQLLSGRSWQQQQVAAALDHCASADSFLVAGSYADADD